MNKYNLLYRADYNLLVCKQCNCVLGRGFESHLRKVHYVKISAEDSGKITNMCIGQESPYWKPQQPLLLVRDFIAVHDGYKCASCNQYGKLLRHIKDHGNEVHKDGRAVHCKVQTIINTGYRRYFGVVSGLVPGRSLDEADISSVVKETMKGEICATAQPEK